MNYLIFSRAGCRFVFKNIAENRKPKPLTLDEEDTRNPTCGSEETFIRNIQLFVLLLVRDRYQTD